MDHGPARLDGDLLDERAEERLRLSDVAGAQELGHIRDELGYHLGLVQQHPALG